MNPTANAIGFTGEQESRNPESVSQPLYRFDALHPAGQMIIADDQVRRSATLSEFAKRGAVGSGRQHLITPIAEQPSRRFQDQRIIVDDCDMLRRKWIALATTMLRA